MFQLQLNERSVQLNGTKTEDKQQNFKFMDQQRSTNSQMESRILGRLKTTALANNQSIDGTSCYEATHLCGNCPLSRKEDGRVLFKRDMAERNPEVINFRRGDDLQQQGNGFKGDAGIEDHTNSIVSASFRQEPSLRKANKVSKQVFLNGYTSHKSGGDEGQRDDSDRNDEEDGVEDDIHYQTTCSSDVVPTGGGYSGCCGNASDGTNNDDDDHDDDDHVNNYDDNSNNNDCGDNDDKSRFYHGNNVHNSHTDSYNNEDDDDNDNDDDYSNDKEQYNNINKEDNYGKESHDSLTADEHLACESEKDSKYSAEESSLSLSFSNSSNDEINITENALGRPDNSTGDVKLPSMGSKTFDANNSNNQNSYLGGNVTNLNQGAKPKTTSQRITQDNVADRRYYYNSRIPSLEVTGINERFLARHTTDTSLPNASNSSDFNLSAESTSFALRRHASSRSKNNSDMLWSLPPPPEGMLRWQRPRANELQCADVGYQETTPMMRLRSDWQLSHQPQSEEEWLLNRIDPRTANQQQSLAHDSLLRTFPGAIGTQDGKSLNRQGWMSSSYDSNSSWHYPRNDLHSSGINISRVALNEPVLTLPAVKSRAPAVVPPSVTLPETRPQSTSSSVASNSFSSNDFSGLNENGQEWLEYSTRLRQIVTQNQENRRLTSSEMVSSRREELRSSNSGTQEASLAPETLQQSSLASNANDDYTLAALERKVAEACAVVERVMKERDERIKAKREAAQREREIRERNEREARERREREARERNEREERERVQRERREREAREREIREREAREARERRRIQEQEGEERERTVARERALVQESLRWQCQHYQRRCKVSFPCCDVFYPCHRCHNGSGACDAADMKANQATHVKCGNCGHEEEINETSQHCSSCGARMSEYFCFKCKHFTGVEKNPFHCNKCGICRIYKDKSFHCDVCNVCLDKRLEGKHKCRPDSGHDECCICLEDAFSGCQILPCSHKVHKECAIAMVQNGVRNCPICRHPLFNQGSR